MDSFSQTYWRLLWHFFKPTAIVAAVAIAVVYLLES